MPAKIAKLPKKARSVTKSKIYSLSFFSVEQAKGFQQFQSLGESEILDFEQKRHHQQGFTVTQFKG